MSMKKAAHKDGSKRNETGAGTPASNHTTKVIGEKCHLCDGSGYIVDERNGMIHEERCPWCLGTGREQDLVDPTERRAWHHRAYKEDWRRAE